MENNTDSRKIVLEMLNETAAGKLSHIAVNEAFGRYRPDAKERAFMSRLYLGVLEHSVYLEYVIDLYSRTKTKKMKPAIRNILMMSLEQMFFMESVPDFAAVSEAGRLARGCGLSGLVPFVNGVLRAIQRDFDREQAEEKMPVWVRLSVPEWIYRAAADKYGKKQAQAFFEAALGSRGGVSFRVNMNAVLEDLREERTSDVIKLLEAEGCSARKGDVPGCIRVSGFENIEGLAAWKSGMVTVQDPSCVHAVLEGVKFVKVKDPLIVDVCAAPGGKSMAAAERFPAGKVTARDVSQAKTALIEENTARLGIENIETDVYDALVFDETLSEKADMVIADLPCSGLGVIGEKPDIKLRVQPGDIKELASLQKKILSCVQGYVKPGGILLYSTCTITKEENENNRKWFLKNHPFKCVKEEQLLPANGDSGFYFAVFKKKNAD